METIVLASHNPGKAREIQEIVKDFGIGIISRDEAGVPPLFDIIEDGETFADNSYKKAFTIMRITGKPAIADDSGLMVDHLDGEPGVRSARFAGEGHNDDDNNAKLLKLMEGVPYEERTARFVSVITLIYPDGRILSARGECEGHILDEKRDKGFGFGYDPLFVPEGYEETFAELGPEVKNKISHRARALEELKKLLKGKSGEE